MQKDDIKHLADLARLELNDTEIATYTEDVTEILGFVDQLQKANLGDGENQIESAAVRNVFREDDDTHESGEYTKDLLKEAPKTKDDFVLVKKILNND